MKLDTDPSEQTRRQFLASGFVAGAVGAAGCARLGSSSGTTTVPPDADTLPTPVRGDPQADVIVMAFEDFACGHCARFVLEELPTLEAEYIEPGTIRYEHHDFPLPLSDQSWQAPSAARAVQATVGEAAFWEFTRKLYENQATLGPSLYESLAAEVGADPETVRTAAVERRYDTTVMADRQQGDELGVESTPTVFVNGTVVESYDAGTIARAIERER